MTPPVRVLVCDDHPIVRSGLIGLLEQEPRLEVVGQAGTSAECLRWVNEIVTTGGGVDVVLMDLNLGEGPDGIHATRELTKRGVPVLVVTTFDSEADILDALEAGARGYVLKDVPTDALVAAVLDAAAGRTVLSPEVQQRLVERTMRPSTTVSSREIEILQQVATGAGNREIAKALFISESTVKTHLAHLFGKLGVDNRTALVARARERRLIR
ncbi:response regulator transcription factor [Luteococcus sediminum]